MTMHRTARKIYQRAQGGKFIRLFLALNVEGIDQGKSFRRPCQIVIPAFSLPKEPVEQCGVVEGRKGPGVRRSLSECEGQSRIAMGEFGNTPSITFCQPTIAAAEQGFDNVRSGCFNANDIGFLWPISPDVILDGN
jgi:hypothetical protein